MVKQAVSIPVFGNGNVFDQNDCSKMMATTGCDGVAIGRMAIARPWLFAEWSDALKIDPEIYFQSASRLAKLMLKHFNPAKALRRFKNLPYTFRPISNLGIPFLAGSRMQMTCRRLKRSFAGFLKPRRRPYQDPL